MVSTTSTRSLLAVNAATVAIALALDWPVATLLWPYWVQSIVIGYFSRKRIVALGRFSIEGFTMNDRAVSPTPATQRSVTLEPPAVVQPGLSRLTARAHRISAL
jgi:hypothetical protein